MLMINKNKIGSETMNMFLGLMSLFPLHQVVWHYGVRVCNLQSVYGSYLWIYLDGVWWICAAIPKESLRNVLNKNI